MSYTLILTFFTLEIFWKFSKNKSSLSACASDRGGSKDSKNGFNFLLAQKLRELEHFEIFKILSKNCRFSKNTAARNGLNDPDSKIFFPKTVSTCSWMWKTSFNHKNFFSGDLVNTLRADDIYICHIPWFLPFSRWKYFENFLKINLLYPNAHLIEEVPRIPKMGLKFSYL